MSTITMLLFFALIAVTLASVYYLTSLREELKLTELISDAQARYITNQYNRIDELEQRCERLRRCLVTELTPKIKTQPSLERIYPRQKLDTDYFIETHLN